MRLRETLLALITVLLVAAGCGSDEESDGEPSVAESSATEPASGAAEPDATPWDDIDLGSLTEAWGCEYALAASDDEQTIGVVLRAPTGTFDAGAVIDLADADWRGEITLGTNLFSEWCTSLLDDPERRPTIAAEAAVSGGTLTFTSAADGDGCGGPDVRASVDGLEITTDDGAMIVLGSLALRSPLWGCPAG